jgi:hypothetical protein
MNRIEKIFVAAALLAAADPVLAGAAVPGTPAPVVGVGIGAIALIGLGYRALKRRIHR